MYVIRNCIVNLYKARLLSWIFNFEAPSQALDEVAWDAAVRTLCLRSPPP